MSIEGTALHTGENVRLTLKPAPVGHGIVFRRVDLNGTPEIRPDISLVSDLVRQTTITTEQANIHTVEHVLSALHGCGIDNAILEMNASEPPILDGSAKPFVDLILEGASCAECVMPREFLEQIVLDMIKQKTPAVEAVSIDDPREHPDWVAEDH